MNISHEELTELWEHPTKWRAERIKMPASWLHKECERIEL